MRAPVETDSPYFPGASNPFKLLRGRPLPQESNPAWETAFPTVNPISAGTAALLRGRVRGVHTRTGQSRSSRPRTTSNPP